MVALHNAILMGGFVATQTMALVDTSGVSPYFLGHGAEVVVGGTGVPFWPTWWSQTGVAEGDPLRHFVMMATTVLTAWAFIGRLLPRFNNGSLSDPCFLFGVLGAVCFGGLGVVNTNLGNGRLVHNTLATSSGMFMLVHLLLAHPTALRFPIFLVFAVIMGIEVLCKRVALWDPASAAFATAPQIALFRLSAIAQWTQLALFATFSN